MGEQEESSCGVVGLWGEVSFFEAVIVVAKIVLQAFNRYQYV
jgi:hypothetical protein